MKSSHVFLLGLVCVAARPVLAEAKSPTPPPPLHTERLNPDQRGGVVRLSGANSVGIQLVPDLLIAYGAEGKLKAPREEQGPLPEERTIVMQASETSRMLRGEVKAHGSTSAFNDLMAGRSDIGLSSRRVTLTETKTLAASRTGDMLRSGNENFISLDSVAFIVNRGNPIRALSASQLRDLMSGTTTRWSELGGPDKPVSIYAHDDKSGTYEMVQQKMFGNGGTLSKTATLLESSEDLADAVASDPNAIGLVGTASIRNAQPLSITSDCGLPPAEPTAFQVKTEEYPLSRRVYFYLADKRVPLADDFVRFAMSPAAQPSIENAGFVGLNPLLSTDEPKAMPTEAASPVPQVASPEAIAAQRQLLQEATAGARRLSVTIRFDTAKATLDGNGLADLERLQHWMQQSGAGQSLTLVGHSSSDGNFDANVALSRRRAHEVEVRLRALGLQPSASLGVGPIRPVACETTAENGYLNRRVEVWVR